MRVVETHISGQDHMMRFFGTDYKVVVTLFCQLNNDSDLFFANNSLLDKVKLYVAGTNFQQNLKVYHLYC